VEEGKGFCFTVLFVLQQVDGDQVAYVADLNAEISELQETFQDK
jgi:hypothetical protein